MLGWVFEVAFAYVKQKEFINRGFLYGPFCPIYGVGIVGIFLIVEGTTYVFYHTGDAPLWIVFLITTFWTTLIEGVTGAVMYQIFHLRWWDYTDRPLNIKGYVCLEFSLIWGVFGTIIFRYFHVWVIKFVDFIPRHFGEAVLVILVVYFLIDINSTVRSLVQFRKLLLEMESISEEYILSKCKLIDEMQNMKKGLVVRSEKKVQSKSVGTNSLSSGDEITKLKTSFDFDEIQYRYEKMSRQISKDRLYQSFPYMKSTRFRQYLNDIRTKRKGDY